MHESHQLSPFRIKTPETVPASSPTKALRVTITIDNATILGQIDFIGASITLKAEPDKIIKITNSILFFERKFTSSLIGIARNAFIYAAFLYFGNF